MKTFLTPPGGTARHAPAVIHPSRTFPQGFHAAVLPGFPFLSCLLPIWSLLLAFPKLKGGNAHWVSHAGLQSVWAHGPSWPPGRPAEPRAGACRREALGGHWDGGFPAWNQGTSSTRPWVSTGRGAELPAHQLHGVCGTSEKSSLFWPVPPLPGCYWLRWRPAQRLRTSLLSSRFPFLPPLLPAICFENRLAIPDSFSHFPSLLCQLWMLIHKSTCTKVKHAYCRELESTGKWNTKANSAVWRWPHRLCPPRGGIPAGALSSAAVIASLAGP